MNPMVTGLCAAAAAVVTLPACGGGSRAVEGPFASTVTAAPVTTLPTTSPSRALPEFALPAYGVEPTTRRALAPGEVTCPAPPGATVEVRGPEPGSPTLTVAVPEGFTEVEPGAETVRLTGPAGMTAEISLAPTTLGAEDEFKRYSDDRVANSPINSLSVLPGDLCGYSGQKLMGVLADRPGEGIEYADRIAHLWTGSGDYLAVVRLEAPGGTPGFEQAQSAMFTDFGITMPG
ncbi:hypothetical protein [Mycolicibacterium sp. HK-90]|uniref:hypothetical protein n=1 Tax=Mycolicibacterium sp. HK-90 TaxID=3056937 RepID=UPI0026591DA4|nr:hypothetical protein [Mycolicibacterium sp. HK-90]WKG04792.1 hypothetical protein QU592_06760 [Mycolicibacterium sp. HK-90]